MMTRRIAHLLGLAALLTGLAACSASGDPSASAIVPESPDLAPGDTVKFIANIAETPEETISWSVVEQDGGLIDAAGTYTAPDNEGTFTVVAASSTRSASTAVRVKKNVQVEVSPASATLSVGDSLVLTAAVTGNVKTVTWTVAEPDGGAVSAEGVYTAPQTPGVFNVVATSTADPSRQGVSTVTVVAPPPPPPPPPPTVTIAVTPGTASVVGGNSMQLTATVSGTSDESVAWSVAEAEGGTVSATGLYTAPLTAGTYHVVATSRADASKADTATIAVTAPPPPPPPPPPPATGGVFAFPGAQGGGALSKGGRGGAVIEVTNLNDSGTGSLRACIAASGPRTCVFRVGGTIQLASRIEVFNPYLTVAGQTAPGGGIQLSGKNMPNAMILVRTHDVTWRYTRIRKGYNSGTVSQSGNVVALMPGVYNVVFDHNSIAWTQDENITVWANSDPPARSATFSWNIIAEPLKQHPVSMITGANTRERADKITDIDFLNNFIANTSHRNPLIKGKRTRFVNNILYNFAFYATQIGGGAQVDVIGNLYRSGPITQSGKHEIQVFPGGNGTTSNGAPSIYVVGNVGPFNSSPTADNWTAMVRQVTGENGSETGSLSTQYRRTTPLATSGAPVVPVPATELEGRLLPTVGASQRLACGGGWVAVRDATDTRIVGEYQSRRGFIPASESEVGGFPSIAAGTPCADGDRDGMPDAWESARGLDPANAADGRAVAADGYTHLERYLNGY